MNIVGIAVYELFISFKLLFHTDSLRILKNTLANYGKAEHTLNTCIITPMKRDISKNNDKNL